MSRRDGPPRNSPYYGPAYWPSVDGRNLHNVGQANPLVREELRTHYGRYLSGVDEVPPMRRGRPDAPDAAEEISMLEEEDDVVGSGVFDPDGSQPTGNQDTGVFASNYALPGYIARERSFNVSRDVVSQSGAPLVTIPAGGMIYVERHGRKVPFMGGGNQPPAPDYEAAEPGGRFRPYAELKDRNRTRHDFERMVPVSSNDDVLPSPIPFQQAPLSPYEEDRELGPARLRAEYDYITARTRMRPSYARVQTSPAYRTVQPRYQARPVQYRPSYAMSGDGDAGNGSPASSTSWVTYGIVGLLVGAASAMILKP